MVWAEWLVDPAYNDNASVSTAPTGTAGCTTEAR